MGRPRGRLFQSRHRHHQCRHRRLSRLSKLSDIRFNCPTCGVNLIVSEEGCGLSVPCPQCSATITIPSQAGDSAPSPSSPGHTKAAGDSHTIVNGICTKCGCSEGAILHFGWKCGRDSSPLCKAGHSAVAGSGVLERCRVCGKDVSPGARTCPSCGEFSPAIAKRCPKCRSSRVTASEGAHYGFGKAAAATLVLGPVGLLAGLLPTKSMFFKCLDCGQIFC